MNSGFSIRRHIVSILIFHGEDGSHVTLVPKFFSRTHKQTHIYYKWSNRVQDILKRVNPSKTGSPKFARNQYFLLFIQRKEKRSQFFWMQNGCRKYGSINRGKNCSKIYFLYFIIGTIISVWITWFSVTQMWLIFLKLSLVMFSFQNWVLDYWIPTLLNIYHTECRLLRLEQKEFELQSLWLPAIPVGNQLLPGDIAFCACRKTITYYGMKLLNARGKQPAKISGRQVVVMFRKAFLFLIHKMKNIF